jgi:hypothetical protein
MVRGEQWTLKQVQGDSSRYREIRAFIKRSTDYPSYLAFRGPRPRGGRILVAQNYFDTIMSK